MFSEYEKTDRMQSVIRDFSELCDDNLPEKVTYGNTVSENLILLYSRETDAFWVLTVSKFHKGEIDHAERMDNIIFFWDLIRRTYRSDYKGLVYRRTGGRAYVYGMDRFKEKHPYTASEIILWDSEQMDHLLMKYDREVIEVSFAILSLQYPQIEKLYKAGFEKIIHKFVLQDRYDTKKLHCFEDCFGNGKTMKQITSLSKGQWSQLIGFSLNLEEYRWLKRILSSHRIDDVNVAPLVRMFIRGEDRFRKSFEKIVNCTQNGQPAYEADQLIRDLINDHGHTGLSAHEACVYLADYIRLCEKNHMEPVYRSEHLRNEHDMMVIVNEEHKQKKNDEETQMIYDDRYEQLKKYLYESDDLIVLLPKKFSDLILEGRNNHNCVGSLYVSRYENGTSNIFFIRRKETRYQSYITVELNQKCTKTIQAFYSCNRRITDVNDLKFIEDWLAHNKEANRSQK